jgi:long-subunit acyl-CoA synthetase (AMP-forming)
MDGAYTMELLGRDKTKFIYRLKVDPGARGSPFSWGNFPYFLYVFAGTQKIGMYSIPVNTSLRGTSLQYILHHSDAGFLVIEVGEVRKEVRHNNI